MFWHPLLLCHPLQVLTLFLFSQCFFLIPETNRRDGGDSKYAVEKQRFILNTSLLLLRNASYILSVACLYCRITVYRATCKAFYQDSIINVFSYLRKYSLLR
jgi:hypothetical protein